MDIRPTTHGKLTYLVQTHAPTSTWTASPGEIQDIFIDNDQILVDLEIGRQESQDHKSWDRNKERVMVEIKGGDGRVIFEHPVEIKDHVRSLTIGLRET